MKRLLTLLLAVIMVCGTVATVSAASVCGDVDLDGNLSIVDATEIQYYLASLKELSDSALANADVDADGEVSVMDATCIRLYLAEQIDKLPADNYEQDLSLYLPYIEAALEEHYEHYDYFVAGGYLCDVDNNGIKELIIVYSIDDAISPYSDSEAPGDVYSIYTMDGDEVVPLVEKELLFIHAGGPNAAVYLMTNDSETLLGFCYSYTHYETEDQYHKGGYWDFYKIDGTELESRHVDYTYYYSSSDDFSEITIDYDNSYVIENEVKSSYKEFDEWLSGFDQECILVSSYGGGNSNTLEDLYNELLSYQV